MQAIIVAGVPGAGKTTIMDSVAKSNNYKFVNIGDLMIKISAERGYTTERDKIRYYTNKVRKELVQEAFNVISKMEGNIVIDTHASVEEHGRYMPGLPTEAVEPIKDSLLGLVCIDATTQEIIGRRMKDASREREVESAETIDVQRIINISVLSAMSLAYDVPLFVVPNEEGKAEESAGIFKKYIADIFGGVR